MLKVVIGGAYASNVDVSVWSGKELAGKDVIVEYAGVRDRYVMAIRLTEEDITDAVRKLREQQDGVELKQLALAAGQDFLDQLEVAADSKEGVQQCLQTLLTTLQTAMCRPPVWAEDQRGAPQWN